MQHSVVYRLAIGGRHGWDAPSRVADMDGTFQPRCRPPRVLVRPVPVVGEPDGPTPGQARGPTWRRTTPGLYVPSDTPDSVEQRIVEQSMRLPEGGAVGGWASLRMHGAAYFDGESQGAQLPVPLVTPYDAARQRQLPGTRVERTRRPIHVVVLHGIPCVAAAWAVVAEAAHAPGMLEAVTVIDMALAAGVVARAEIDGVRFHKADVAHFRHVVCEAVSQQARIDQLTHRALVARWPIERIDPTLRALFRAAGAEFVAADTPPKVTITEYLEIAKAFYPSGKEAKFVNGVLDHMAHEARPQDFL